MEWKYLLNTERPRKSTGSQEVRSEFERDFDRSVFSTPVRRLQDKAQVFPLETHDAVRNRLTHSLEVSSVARGLASAVSNWLYKEKKICQDKIRDIEAIAATCGLIHDLGNPPFGHSGEDAIREWFEKEEHDLRNNFKNEEQLFQDFLRFEGNAQSLRLITKLQILADYNGLNLTFGTLSASLKYTAKSNDIKDKSINHAKSKPGYFASEDDIVKQIRDKTQTGDSRNPITLLVESADDIVFSVCDIEDGVKKNILTWQDIKDLDVFKEVITGVNRILGNSADPIPDDIYASAFRTSAIGIMVKYIQDSFKDNYCSIIDGTFTSELYRVSKAEPIIKELKRIGSDKVYCTPSNLKLEIMGRKIIHDLMDVFWEGAEKIPPTSRPQTNNFPGKIGALFSENYIKIYQHSIGTSSLPQIYHQLQLVTDYICGMTDTFAKSLHSDLTNG